MADEPKPAAHADPAPPPLAPDQQIRIAAAIRAWRDTVIANGPIARDTACWNHLEAALEPLAASILKEI